MLAAEVIGRAAFPRLSNRLRWWTRSWRGFALYVAFNTLVLFSVRQFVMPRVRAWWDDQQRAQLTEQLGREPTVDELDERWQAARADARAQN